jgi:hypothetical protein
MNDTNQNQQGDQNEEMTLAKTSDRGALRKEVTSQQEMARAETEVQAMIIQAIKRPRNETMIRKSIMEAVKRKGFAVKAYYAFPRGAGTVQGPSVHLAREMSRLWGNIITGFQVVADDEEFRTLRAQAWDLENNVRRFKEVTFKKLILRKAASKTYKKGWNVPDERDLRELTNRHGAILERGCILEVLPPDMVDEAYLGAIASMSKSKSKKDKGDVIEAFKDFGIEKGAILEKYSITDISELSGDQIAELRGIYQSIKDGNSRPGEYFNLPPEEGGQPAEEKPIEAKVEEPLFPDEGEGEK